NGLSFQWKSGVIPRVGTDPNQARMVVMDANGDGQRDILFADKSGTILFLNTGGGGFTLRNVGDDGTSPSSSLHAPFIVDLDRDGRDELVYPSQAKLPQGPRWVSQELGEDGTLHTTDLASPSGIVPVRIPFATPALGWGIYNADGSGLVLDLDGD